MYSYSEFIQYVKENIKNYMSPAFSGAETMIRQFIKNNGIQLDGLIIRRREDAVPPVIYLNGYYKAYLDNVEMPEIMMEIARLYEYNSQVRFQKEELLNYEKQKENITFRMVNAKSNREKLKEMPHRTEQDLAMVYTIELEKFPMGAATVAIINSLMELYGTSEEELHQLAMENSVKKYPFRIQNMSEVFREMYPFDIDSVEYQEMKAVMDAEMNEKHDMYVISNPQKHYGASVLFYPDAMERIAGELGGGYYILPSSVHEMIVVRENEIPPEELKQMVEEVNATEVSPEEKLSDKVYHYDAAARKLEIACPEENIALYQQRNAGR